MHDLKIFGWTAKRSGPAMTIKGEDYLGKPLKLTATLIETRGRLTVATLADGREAILEPLAR